MPKIYEYMGISLMFYSNEHEPIHIHAKYDNSMVKVSFFINDGIIYKTTYKEEFGKFSPAKLKELKKFISVYKYNIISAWYDCFVLHKKIHCQKIEQKI